MIQRRGLDRFRHLPLIVGEGAPRMAPALFGLLAGEPDLTDRITAMTRVADRRWTLTFDNGVQLAAFGKNLTNRVYKQNGVDFLSSLGFDIAYFGAPRTYGVELSWKY